MPEGEPASYPLFTKGQFIPDSNRAGRRWHANKECLRQTYVLL